MKREALLVALLMTLSVPPALAAEWRIVRAESRLEFVPTYQGQEAKGVFHRFEVSLSSGSDAPASGKLAVSVALASADMGSQDIDDAIRGNQWFDVTHGPEARFASDDIVAQSDGRFLARGTLSLKGIERQVAVPFTWWAAGDDARMQGQLVLRRIDFGIGTGEWASSESIGLDVTVRFDVKLRRKE